MAEIRGRAAHAGIRPEDGRSAIAAAARAIAAMRARTARRRDDRQRRHDRGRHGDQRRSRALPGRGRGAQRRPATRRDGGDRDDRRPAGRRRRGRVRSRRQRRADVQRLPAKPREPSRWRSPSGRCGLGYEPRHISSGGAIGRQRVRGSRLSVRQPGQRDRAQPRAGRAHQRRRAREPASSWPLRWSTRPGERDSNRSGACGERGFEPVDSEVGWAGRIIRAGVERFRFADGAEVTRDKVWHPGAVGILAVDDEHVWLTRQPREAVGDPASLEVPAGKLDVPGEPPLETAKRELVEEIGKRAAQWEELVRLLDQPRVQRRARVAVSRHRAVGRPQRRRARRRTSGSRSCPWPLAQLDEAIDAVRGLQVADRAAVAGRAAATRVRDRLGQWRSTSRPDVASSGERMRTSGDGRAIHARRSTGCAHSST